MNAVPSHLTLRDVSTWASTEPPSTGLQSADLADAAIVRRVAEGDSEAFDSLFQRYQGPIIGFLHGMLGEREDALDAAQEVFVRVFTQAHRYQPQAPFRSWLYRFATNVAIDQVRRRRRRWFGMLPARPIRGTDSGDERDPLDDVASTASTALDQLLCEERDSAVARAVASLPPPYRLALVLRDLQDLSYEEVAEVLGCRVGTVKSRINRARNLLRDTGRPRDAGQPFRVDQARAELDSHARACAACSKLLAAEDRLQSALQELRLSSRAAAAHSPAFDARVKRAVRQVGQPASAPRWFAWPLLTAALASAIAIGAIVTVSLREAKPPSAVAVMADAGPQEPTTPVLFSNGRVEVVSRRAPTSPSTQPPVGALLLVEWDL